MAHGKIPKVFISYSWDSVSHRDWVRDLATRMRLKSGIDVSLDQWDAVPGDQLTEFMGKAVRESDFVLLICTPEYKKKSDQNIGGVGYEGDIMTGEVFTEKNHRKFIPLLREGSWQNASPSWVRGKYYIPLNGNPYSEDAYLDLIKTLHNRRSPAPLIGPPPIFLSEKENTKHLDEVESKSYFDQKSPELQYSNLFTIASTELPYIVLIGGWENGVNEYRRGEVSCNQDFQAIYRLPSDFLKIPMTKAVNFDEKKCRLTRYDCAITSAGSPNQLVFEFSEILYSDYCRSGEHLDELLPSSSTTTFREKYAPRIQLDNFTAQI